MSLDPKVWVGCLGCYNGGDLTGQWFDAIDCPTEMSEFDDAVFKPCEKSWRVASNAKAAHLLEAHEELWVMDHEDFDGWLTGECSPMEAKRIAQVISDIEADYVDPAAVAAWADNEGALDVESWADVESDFSEAYNGEWGSEEEFAQNLADDIGAVNADASWPNDCIDWEKATRELFMDYWSAPAAGGGVYVFRSC